MIVWEVHGGKGYLGGQDRTGWVVSSTTFNLPTEAKPWASAAKTPGEWFRPGHELAVALFCARNMWVKIAVSRNSRCEAGCAQPSPRFGARHIFRRRRKKILRVFFSPCGRKKYLGPLFSTSPEVFKKKKRIYVYVMCVTWKRHRDWALGTLPITDYGEWRI